MGELNSKRILAISLLFFLVPSILWAWGPTTHLLLAERFLQDSHGISPLLIDLIRKYYLDFLYGCISADIILGKKFMDYIHQCHNWRVWLKIFKNAPNDRGRVFAHGYLAHLAADTVAHNYFIPVQLMESFKMRALGHVYWEVRFDTAISTPELWHLLDHVGDREFVAHDELLEKTIQKTIVSFRTHKRIFDSLILLNRMKRFKTLVARISERSPWALPKDRIDEMMGLSVHAIRDVMIHRERSTAFHEDPMGFQKIFLSKVARKQLRKLNRYHPMSPEQQVITFQALRTLFCGALGKELHVEDVNSCIEKSLT